MTLGNNRLRISAEILVLYPGLRSKRFPRAFPRFKVFFAFELAFPSPPRSFQQCCARSNFHPAKKRKMPQTGGKTSETLATQAIYTLNGVPESGNIVSYHEKIKFVSSSSFYYIDKSIFAQTTV